MEPPGLKSSPSKVTIVQEKKDEAAVLKRAGQKLALEENTLRVTISRLEEKKGEIADSSSDLVREHHQLEIQERRSAKAAEACKHRKRLWTARVRLLLRL